MKRDSIDEDLQVPSEEYCEQVKEALEHLYDLAYLQSLSLGRGRVPRESIQPTGIGRALHRDLIAAIETLNPGPEPNIGSASARPYHFLVMHFIEGETVHASANRVGVSRRQAHRDLRLGIERVAQVLLAQQTTRSQETLNEADPSTIQAEMAQLQSQPEIINLRELLNRAVETVALLAAQQDVDICLDAPIDPPTVAADPVIAEQVLVDILSRAVGQAHPGTFRIELTPGRNRPTIQVRYFPDTSLSDAPFITPVLTQLVERLGWECAVRDYAEGEREAVLRLSISRVTVLVVDDNRGLIELLQRYLGDCGVHIIAAASGEEGLALARENEPDAIVLDVMMPGMHGWEVLQRLRNHPTTAGTPVIICSVFNNPSLAYSLGASALVPKPVSRHAILKTLQELDILSPEM